MCNLNFCGYIYAQFHSEILIHAQKQHFTQHAIHDIVDKIHKNLKNKEITCGIFIDLKKAFDHKISLSKLYHYDRNKRDLNGQSQVTTVNYTTSNDECYLYGVPQGSVLGPLLFLFFINDICASSYKRKFYQFPDDTSILYSHRNMHTLEQVNNKLEKICQWVRAKKLTLKYSKCLAEIVLI